MKNNFFSKKTWKSGLLIFALYLSGLCMHATAQTYNWKTVRIGGGGMTTSIQAHPLVQNLYFITTDVGTPYRWNNSTQRWEGLFYNRPASDWSRNSCGNIAFAPGDASGNILYATINNTYGASQNGTILKSTDRGNNWTDCLIPLDIQTNSDQSKGQRLAVDPQNSNVVYVTTRSYTSVVPTNGTFKSINAGTSWTKINNLYGNFIYFDLSGGMVSGVTKNIFIGTAEGVYLSTDGGINFALMSGSPANANRASIHSNGTFYVSSGLGLFKWNGSTWLNITPPSAGGYAGVEVNPNNSNQVVVNSNSFSNYLFNAYRSNDGGANWTYMETHTAAIADLSEVPWFGTALGQNLQDFCWDPFNQNMVWMTDFFFASQTTNIWAFPNPIWKPRAAGHEETVPCGNLLCPPSGSNLLHSTLADIGGWDHKSLTAPPEVGMQLFFPWRSDGGWANMTGVAVQENNPNFIARVGRAGWSGPGYAGYSDNGGNTYTLFNIPSDVSGGRIAVSATSETLVWVPQSGAPQRSTTRGSSWQPISTLPSGIIGGGANVFSSGCVFPLASDKMNGNKFYVYKNTGGMYVSTDGGVSFTVAGNGLPANYISNNVTVETTPGIEGDIWVGMWNGSGGLYHSINSGLSFTRISNVQRADFIGVGKASPFTPTIPAVYVFGTVNNINSSLFRSNDNGVTWESLGTPAIGRAPLAMAADRQVYGRVFIGAGGNGFFVGTIPDIDTQTPPGTTFLVQPGGTGAAWSGVTGTVVDLTIQGQSLDEWYKATTFSAGDQIWIIKGAYTLTDSIVTKTKEKIYGGFAGTEQTITGRVKGTNAWDFTNETIIDGNNLVRGFVNSTGATIDGLTIQKCAYPVTSTDGNAAAVKITSSSIVQNCIVRNNTITGPETAGGIYAGGVFLTTGGKLLNSYIHDNSCANTGGGGNGGGVTITQLATVDGCTINNNTAYNSGGGVNINAKTGGAVVNNCIISNNTTTTGSGGGVNAVAGAAFTAGLSLTISNCSISSNTAKINGGGVFMDVTNGGWEGNPINVTQCVISSNTATGTTGSTGNGGGLYLSRGIFNVNGCTINSNVSKAPTTIDNNGGGGIFTTYSNGSTLNLTNTILKGNVIGTGKNVGSAINVDMSNTLVRNCLITGNTGATCHQQGAGRTCIYQNCTIAGNVNSTGSEVGIYLGWGVGVTNTFTNCLFYKCSSNPIGYYTTSGKDPEVTYCGFDITVPTAYANKAGCITGLTSASFTDAANGDWSLSSTSAAIDAGIPVTAVTTDITGITVRPKGAGFDMGAYEAVSGTTGIENIKQLVCFIENHILKIQGLSIGAQLRVYAVTGILLVNQTANSSNVSIPLVAGFYMVTGFDAGRSFSKKIIVR